MRKIPSATSSTRVPDSRFVTPMPHSYHGTLPAALTVRQIAVHLRDGKDRAKTSGAARAQDRAYGNAYSTVGEGSHSSRHAPFGTLRRRPRLRRGQARARGARTH